jgi:dTDP-4-dehydrorhamnose reductase
VAQVLAKGGDEVVDWLGEKGGLYHLAGSGFASRYEWACEILRCDPEKDKQVTQQIMPSNWKDFHTLARRPLFSALDCTHFFDVFGMRLPDWKVALQMAMKVGI